MTFKDLACLVFKVTDTSEDLSATAVHVQPSVRKLVCAGWLEERTFLFLTFGDEDGDGNYELAGDRVVALDLETGRVSSLQRLVRQAANRVPEAILSAALYPGAVVTPQMARPIRD